MPATVSPVLHAFDSETSAPTAVAQDNQKGQMHTSYKVDQLLGKEPVSEL